MLLNISNHPSINWTKEQRDAAISQYGGIADQAFPHIAPDATTEMVYQLAKQYATRIINNIEYANTLDPSVKAVHLMGEMTFVFALVGLLQKMGITVVCSTTQRTVLEEKDGKKTAQFQFVQFRAYPVLN